MNAVKTLRKIEEFFNRNHNAFVRFGGLFALIFFVLYVPYNMQSRTMKMYDEQVKTNRHLSMRIEQMSNEVEFLSLSYEKQKRVRDEVECLARNIYFEAGAEPRAGKIAVAEVTMNRVRHRDYPRTVCGVVHQRNQFSWVGNKNRVRDNKTWRESVKIAENILISGKRYGIIGDALFFHADYVEPEWASQKKLVTQIGNHLFYR